MVEMINMLRIDWPEMLNVVNYQTGALINCAMFGKTAFHIFILLMSSVEPSPIKANT